MKKINLTLLFVFMFCFFNNTDAFSQDKKKTVFGKTINPNSINSENGLIRCSTDEYEKFLQKKYPERLNEAQREAEFISIVEKYKNLRSQTGGIIYIPVVVHVIHNGDAYGVDENIKDEQVMSQITVMNQDYRRMVGTPGYNTNSVGADTNIEFVLAKVDPNGNPTNGIDRVNLCISSYAGSTDNATIAAVENIKPQTIWDPTLYMNMWSVNWSGSGLLGYAQFPSTGTSTANTDGVVSGHTFFGSRTIFPGGTYGSGTSYDKGRTMTHEVGHFLGLYHTFQGGCGATGDSCADTPAVATANYGCPTGIDSCPSNAGVDMIENYMDYTNDSCMNIFTQNQNTRIASFLNSYPRRASLKTSTKDIAIPLFANDAEVIIENGCGASSVSPSCTNPNPTSPDKVVSLYNRGTSTLTSATITYNMNSGTTYTFNWTGSLESNKFAYVTLTNTGVSGTLNTTITAVNGTTDQRVSNNTASKTFGASTGASLANVPYTAFTFTLLGDPFGSETTWNLKNQAGTTLYSGGPYTDATTAGTQAFVTNQPWTLPVGCYTFTIDDSYGDGLSGSQNSSGTSNNDAGSWTIKTNSGAITLGTGGGDFGDSQTFSFTNTALATENFNPLENISIYPNPTTNELNVVLYEGFNSTSSYIIYNNLGQVVKQSNKIEAQNEFKINTSQFSNGIYFLKIEKDGVSKTLKFIKN